MPDIYKALEAIVRRAARDARTAAPAAPADDVIADMALLQEWEPGKYAVGDVRVRVGQPRRCLQAHDSTAQGDAWAPENAPALWGPYHATSARWALPWVQPTCADDSYRAGEYMIWTDGLIYRCKADATVHGPDVLPQAWEVQEATA